MKPTFNTLNQLKFYIKSGFAYLLYFTGVLFVLKAIMLRNKAVVLMYHRVLSKAEMLGSFSHEGIVVDVESFASQMEYLKGSFNVISLEDFLDRIPKRKFEKHSCLITFDDGWIDNYTNAFPILKIHDLPAVIFLPVGFIGTGKKFWRETLSELLYRISREASEESLQILNNIGLNCLAGKSFKQTKKAIQEYVDQLKEKPLEEKTSVLSHMTQNSENLPHLSCNIDLFLDWDNVREMSKSGIAFGSHSYHHNILTQLSLDDADFEINSSRAAIKDQVGVLPRTFCYPNGDYSDPIAKIVSHRGYEAAFTTRMGHFDVTDNPFTIKRVNISQNMTRNTPLFLTRVLGLF